MRLVRAKHAGAVTGELGMDAETRARVSVASTALVRVDSDGFAVVTFRGINPSPSVHIEGDYVEVERLMRNSAEELRAASVSRGLPLLEVSGA